LDRTKTDKKFKKIKIQIKNADVSVAGGITHYLYEMVDEQELHSVSIDEVRKSKNSIEVILIAVVSFGITFIAGKVVDIPYNRAVKKILLMLRKRKRKKQGTLDAFMNDEPIE